MSVFSLLLHAGVLIQFGKDVQSIVGELAQHKEKFPSKEEFLKVIDDAFGVLTSGCFSFPWATPAQLKEVFDALRTAVNSL